MNHVILYAIEVSIENSLVIQLFLNKWQVFIHHSQYTVGKRVTFMHLYIIENNNIYVKYFVKYMIIFNQRPFPSVCR